MDIKSGAICAGALAPAVVDVHESGDGITWVTKDGSVGGRHPLPPLSERPVRNRSQVRQTAAGPLHVFITRDGLQWRGVRSGSVPMTVHPDVLELAVDERGSRALVWPKIGSVRMLNLETAKSSSLSRAAWPAVFAPDGSPMVTRSGCEPQTVRGQKLAEPVPGFLLHRIEEDGSVIRLALDAVRLDGGGRPSWLSYAVPRRIDIP